MFHDLLSRCVTRLALLPRLQRETQRPISQKNMSTENKLGMSGKRVCGNLGDVIRSLSRLGITLQKQTIFFFFPMNAIYMTNITHAAICYCMFNLSPAF